MKIIKSFLVFGLLGVGAVARADFPQGTYECTFDEGDYVVEIVIRVSADQVSVPLTLHGDRYSFKKNYAQDSDERGYARLSSSQEISYYLQDYGDNYIFDFEVTEVEPGEKQITKSRMELMKNGNSYQLDYSDYSIYYFEGSDEMVMGAAHGRLFDCVRN